ncbi:MAG: hypothetical protein GF355_08780 [Candidatus Eisenbacteria bacterium]|nr:hypothetical protein [Candidatus Eisenbacteria bacterium]
MGCVDHLIDWGPATYPPGVLCEALGIREWYPGSCPEPTPVAAATWGAIKSLYSLTGRPAPEKMSAGLN